MSISFISMFSLGASLFQVLCSSPESVSSWFLCMISFFCIGYPVFPMSSSLLPPPSGSQSFWFQWSGPRHIHFEFSLCKFHLQQSFRTINMKYHFRHSPFHNGSTYNFLTSWCFESVTHSVETYFKWWIFAFIWASDMQCHSHVRLGRGSNLRLQVSHMVTRVNNWYSCRGVRPTFWHVWATLEEELSWATH